MKADTSQALLQEIRSINQNLAHLNKKVKEDLPTKKDLGQFATMKDLERFATKKDLEQLATKKDLEHFATKKDLEHFATKKDVEKMAIKITEDISDLIQEMTVEIVTKKEFDELEKRVSALENN